MESKMPDLLENPQFLTTQIITYIGNKCSLIKNIEEKILVISKVLDKAKIGLCRHFFQVRESLRG